MESGDGRTGLIAEDQRVLERNTLPICRSRHSGEAGRTQEGVLVLSLRWRWSMLHLWYYFPQSRFHSQVFILAKACNSCF